MSKLLNFYFLLIIAMITWGLAWPFGKIIANSLPIHVLVFWRFVVTFLSILPLMFLFRVSFRLETWRDKVGVILGGILYGIYNYFFFKGLDLGLAGAGGVLVTTLNPVVTYLMVALLEKRQFSLVQMIGLLVGIVGGSCIIKVWSLDYEVFFSSGNAFFLLCAITWAILSINSQKMGKTISPIAFSFYVYLTGSIIEFLLSFQDPSFFNIQNMTKEFWISMLYISSISTAFGTTVYFFAATKLGSQTASSFIFLVPVSAYLSSFIAFGEDLQWNVILGGTLATLSVFIINQKES